MIRLTTKQKRLIVARYTEGYAMPILAVVWRVPITRIEAVIRQAMQAQP